MKNILVINSHSVVDVITNSSTELFVCDTNKTLDLVTEILTEMNLIDYVHVYIYTDELYNKYIEKSKKEIKNSYEYYKSVKDECNNLKDINKHNLNNYYYYKRMYEKGYHKFDWKYQSKKI